MNKYIDTSKLETYQSGKYIGKFNWTNNIGKELYFEYGKTSGYIKIVDYVKSKPQGYITLSYGENVVTTTTSNLLHLKIPSLINQEKQSNKYKYKQGEIIYKYKNKLQIVSQTRIVYGKSSCRGYEINCLDCGYTYKTREDKFSTCPICGKRSSFSERFIYRMLQLANIDFECQKEFELLPNKYFDIYLPEYNSIIEINGQQHYEPVRLVSKYTPEEIFINSINSDKIKKQFAKDNNIQYCIIDARDPKGLYNQTIETLSFINFENVKEIECEKFANYKYVIDECLLWNDGESLENISTITKSSIQTIQNKLRLGFKYNICNYDKSINMHNHKIINPNCK